VVYEAWPVRVMKGAHHRLVPTMAASQRHLALREQGAALRSRSPSTIASNGPSAASPLAPSAHARLRVADAGTLRFGRSGQLRVSRAITRWARLASRAAM
jgi:hypothetical protein